MSDLCPKRLRLQKRSK